MLYFPRVEYNVNIPAPLQSAHVVFGLSHYMPHNPKLAISGEEAIAFGIESLMVTLVHVQMCIHDLGAAFCCGLCVCVSVASLTDLLTCLGRVAHPVMVAFQVCGLPPLSSRQFKAQRTH